MPAGPRGAGSTHHLDRSRAQQLPSRTDLRGQGQSVRPLRPRARGRGLPAFGRLAADLDPMSNISFRVYQLRVLPSNKWFRIATGALVGLLTLAALATILALRRSTRGGCGRPGDHRHVSDDGRAYPARRRDARPLQGDRTPGQRRHGGDLYRRGHPARAPGSAQGHAGRGSGRRRAAASGFSPRRGRLQP